MSSVNTTVTLDGLFKAVYGDSVLNLLPDFAILSKKVPFSPREKIGQRYEVPVKLQFEGGFSYGASGDGAFTLNNAIAGKIGRAQVDASQIVLRSQMDYESAFKAQGSKQSFVDATQALVENMTESFAKRQELAMLYGGTGLGTVGAVTGGALTITAASFAPGIWVGMENATLDAYNGSTKINTNAPLVVSSVNVATEVVTVTGNSTDLAALSAGHVLYFQGAYGKEMTGIDKILTNSGVLFNIDASAYALWKSTPYSVGGQIAMSKVLLAASQAVPFGLKEKTSLLLAPKRWTNLNNELNALRKIDETYSGMNIEAGTEGITYHGVSGDLEIMSHPFVKEGEGFILPEKRLKRIGATDITFRRPGGNPGNFFQELQAAAGYELRAYSDQQIFNEAPAMSVKLTGITD